MLGSQLIAIGLTGDPVPREINRYIFGVPRCRSDMARKWNVLIPENIDSAGPDSIRDICNFSQMDESDGDNLLKDIHRYDAIVVRVADLNRHVLKAAERLQVISKHGSGLDNIDIDTASEMGIIVCNTPAANSRSVAEHAMALLLAIRRNIIRADEHVRGGGWDRASHAGREIAGDSIGLLGLGAIGKETAKLAMGFGLDVSAYDPYVEDFPEDINRKDDINDLFLDSDVVSIHAPLTPETRKSVSIAELEALGPQGVLINTSRGAIVNQKDLINYLKDGRIAGAGLDVFEYEPPSQESELLQRNNVVLSPHIGGLTNAALRRMSEEACKNVQTVYEGNVPESAVNPEVTK